jgi:hypothetical protein
MAIKASAQVVAISPYDDENVYVEVRIVAKRDGDEMDGTNQLFVIPISSNANDDIRTAVKAWTGTNWDVEWELLDTVSLYGGASIL